MNIFHLSSDPKEAAKYYVDRHVVKIITEINQCLSSAYPKGTAPYKWTHTNHPMTKWCRASKSNFKWSIEHCQALCEEYTYRYGKIHKGEGVLDWYRQNDPQIENVEMTAVPRCFGTFKDLIPETKNHIEDYRNYYRVGKKHLFNWKKRETPEWILDKSIKD